MAGHCAFGAGAAAGEVGSTAVVVAAAAICSQYRSPQRHCNIGSLPGPVPAVAFGACKVGTCIGFGSCLASGVIALRCGRTGNDCSRPQSLIPAAYHGADLRDTPALGGRMPGQEVHLTRSLPTFASRADG